MIRKLNLNIGNSQSVFSIVEKEQVQTMKIGIMGGTFEPIHIGHLLLGEFAYEDFGLDEIWFLPNGNPPHKETLGTEEAMHHRIEMVRIAIKSNPNFSLNLSEADTKKHSYTYQTMRHFNEILKIRPRIIITLRKRWNFFQREIRIQITILFSERILCLLLKSGKISEKFLRPVRFLQQCVTTKMLQQ